MDASRLFLLQVLIIYVFLIHTLNLIVFLKNSYWLHRAEFINKNVEFLNSFISYSSTSNPNLIISIKMYEIALAGE